MKKMRLWAQMLGVVITLMLFIIPGLSAAKPADAPLQSQLPSSVMPAGGAWKKMNTSSFKGTVSDLLRQCQEDVADDNGYLLTTKHCEMLRVKTQMGDYAVVQVPDGIMFDVLHGLRNNKSHRWTNMLKQMGNNRKDRAQLYDVGDGIYAYWFTGDRGISCNNLAWVFWTPPPVTEVKMICVDVPFDGGNDSEMGDYFYLNGVYQQSCCCDDGLSIPSLSIYSEGSYEKSSGSTDICYPVKTQ